MTMDGLTKQYKTPIDWAGIPNLYKVGIPDERDQQEQKNVDDKTK